MTKLLLVLFLDNIWIISDSYVWRGAETGLDEIKVFPLDLFNTVDWSGSSRPFSTSSKEEQQPQMRPFIVEGMVWEEKNIYLITAMMEDLYHLHLQNLSLKVIFSGLIQRCWWRSYLNSRKLGKA